MPRAHPCAGASLAVGALDNQLLGTERRDMADKVRADKATAVAFVSGDPVEAAKSLREFAKANPLLIIKGGVFEGKAISAAEVGRLADLESREVLLAKLAGAMKANLSKAAALFQAPLAQAV